MCSVADPDLQSTVEPAYLIYLHFYAASSMEACALPLYASSPNRTPLLNQARKHYDLASELIQKAEDAVGPRSRPSSFTSTSSSIESPAGSVSSRAWTASTGLSSPAHSISSIEDLPVRSCLCRRESRTRPLTPVTKKRVSFALPVQEPWVEPYIRPDSPTLGFDDEYFTTALQRPSLPEIPRDSPPMVETIDEEEDCDVTPKAMTPSSNPFDSHHAHFNLTAPDPVDRYCDVLAGLKSQIASHKSDLDIALRPVEAEKIVAGLDNNSAMLPVSTSDEMRMLDRKARIERLRQNNWQRKRFDPTRYEKLRSAVLAELS